MALRHQAGHGQDTKEHFVSDNKNPALDPDGTLPKVPGWVSITEAAQMLGVSRQHGFRMAKNRRFETLSRVGTSFTFVVKTEEVERLLRDRQDTPSK